MFVFINPKFDLPKWLRYTILVVCGIVLVVCMLCGMLEILSDLFGWGLFEY